MLVFRRRTLNDVAFTTSVSIARSPLGDPHPRPIHAMCRHIPLQVLSSALWDSVCEFVQLVSQRIPLALRRNHESHLTLTIDDVLLVENTFVTTIQYQSHENVEHLANRHRSNKLVLLT